MLPGARADASVAAPPARAEKRSQHRQRGEDDAADPRVDSLVSALMNEQVYVIRFTCGCVVLVGHGRMIRRVGGVALVCAHVAAT